MQGRRKRQHLVPDLMAQETTILYILTVGALELVLSSSLIYTPNFFSARKTEIAARAAIYRHFLADKSF